MLKGVRCHVLDCVCYLQFLSEYGSEFINFLSSVMTARVIKKFEEADLFSEITYNEIMCRLLSTKKVDSLDRLGLLPRMKEPSKKKRGRPRKNPS
ncbi:MAG: hypothetical protein JEY71_15140 [Sphaerochaeta sp.]|nr:hypothetical protein [Sphaerochaeta sp.]